MPKRHRLAQAYPGMPLEPVTIDIGSNEGARHQIRLYPCGRLHLLDHPKFREELALSAMGAPTCRCLTYMHAWQGECRDEQSPIALRGLRRYGEAATRRHTERKEHAYEPEDTMLQRAIHDTKQVATYIFRPRVDGRDTLDAIKCAPGITPGITYTETDRRWNSAMRHYTLSLRPSWIVLYKQNLHVIDGWFVLQRLRRTRRGKSAFLVVKRERRLLRGAYQGVLCARRIYRWIDENGKPHE